MITPPERQYILYVEDDIEDVELLNHVLRLIEFNIRIINFSDGVKALEFLEKAKQMNRLPELIFLDINMSKMNGKETFVCLHADKIFARIPLAILSTSNFDMDMEYFAKYQIPYINKPGDVNKFKEEVFDLLQNRLSHVNFNKDVGGLRK